jgi:acetyl/propionyl-CoA carboxylase alpha subunit
VRKLLVANRGEIARRVFRTARRMGIDTVAVFSDADAAAPHVGDADEAVRLAGVTPGETYLDVEAVVGAAHATGADAVHPGYGFLSENAGFARACADAGLTFVGPSPEAIETMGSKIEAKELMDRAGVPVLRDEGFPLLVKAAFGGGGRGMRIVRDQTELDEAVAAAEREAAAAFGDGTVFTERYVENPRHIEVQIFGDVHGDVIHLFERECSIQRRYQKVIEEAPSPAVTPELRDSLCAAAVDAGKALDYTGAGTVEFVLDPSGAFFFLEVNTRLQVEHPVTELVTGLDLVELQLRVARGESLAEVLPERPSLSGWAVEARLYAEDVEAGFVPTSGRIDRFHVPDGEGIRVDAGYDDGSTVSTHYDAMLAKVIAGGRDRAEAVRRLRDALDRTRVHGLPTNRQMLVRVLDHEAFQRGEMDTSFLERHGLTDAPDGAVDLRPRALAAALAQQAAARADAPVLGTIPSGWRNVVADLQHRVYAVDDTEIDVGYGLRRAGLVAEIDGETFDAEVGSTTAEQVTLTVGWVRRRYEVQVVGDRVHVDDIEGSTTFAIVPRLPEPGAYAAPGSLLAPLPGSISRVLVEAGQRVTAGQTLVVLEAMKMEHTVAAGEDGTVAEILVAEGVQVDTGQVLVVVDIEEDD